MGTRRPRLNSGGQELSTSVSVLLLLRGLGGLTCLGARSSSLFSLLLEVAVKLVVESLSGCKKNQTQFLKMSLKY